METKKRALGRGLEELFNNENLDLNFEQRIIESTPINEIIDIDIEELRPNPYQPRQIFDEEALNELAVSIKEHGVFQPIIVKKSIKGYEIIAGERRVRASKIAGLTKVPAIIKEMSEEEMMEIALLENLQRENLTAIEEAHAYKSLLDNLGITQEELSKKVGKSRSHITNIIGLLRLPSEVQKMVNSSKISMGHARALSKLDSKEEMTTLANKIVNENLTVRDIENIETKKPVKHKKEVNSEYKYVEDMLREKLDTKVKITDKKIEITYVNVADLNRILEILDVKE